MISTNNDIGLIKLSSAKFIIAVLTFLFYCDSTSAQIINTGKWYFERDRNIIPVEWIETSSKAVNDFIQYYELNKTENSHNLVIIKTHKSEPNLIVALPVHHMGINKYKLE